MRQISVLSRQNIGTLSSRSPMFFDFRTGCEPPKNPRSRPVSFTVSSITRSVMSKDKNHKNPLNRMGGKAPGASLPLWPYKSKLLTPKSKVYHHLLSEGSHPLQGDKPKKPFPWQHHPKNIGILYAVCYIYSFRGNVFLLFISL